MYDFVYKIFVCSLWGMIVNNKVYTCSEKIFRVSNRVYIAQRNIFRASILPSSTPNRLVTLLRLLLVFQILCNV